jgi:hypothetical protein
MHACMQLKVDVKYAFVFHAKSQPVCLADEGLLLMFQVGREGEREGCVYRHFKRDMHMHSCVPASRMPSWLQSDIGPFRLLNFIKEGKGLPLNVAVGGENVQVEIRE